MSVEHHNTARFLEPSESLSGACNPWKITETEEESPDKGMNAAVPPNPISGSNMSSNAAFMSDVKLTSIRQIVNAKERIDLVRHHERSTLEHRPYDGRVGSLPLFRKILADEIPCL